MYCRHKQVIPTGDVHWSCIQAILKPGNRARHCTVRRGCRLLELVAVDNSYRSAEDGQNQFTLSLRGAAPAMALYTCVRKVSRSCCVAASISCKPCSTQIRIERLTSNRQSPSIVHSIQQHVLYQELCGHSEDTRCCKHSCNMAACCTCWNWLVTAMKFYQLHFKSQMCHVARTLQLAFQPAR